MAWDIFGLGAIRQELSQIGERLQIIELTQQIMENKMQEAFQDLRDELARNTGVVSSVKALMADLIARIEAAPSLEAVREITAGFKTNTNELAAAVEAGTKPKT